MQKQYGHDITLVVKTQLPKSEVEAWLDCVEEIGPPGVIAGTTDMKDDKIVHEEVVEHYNYNDDEWRYIIPLTRNVTQKEGKKIVDEWASYYDLDFEITSSSNPVSPIEFDQFDVVDVDEYYETEYQRTTKEAVHNNWVLEQIENGWRFGVTFNKESKMSPFIKAWNELTKSQKNNLDH